MNYIGIFMREKPTTCTNTRTFAWCHIWVNGRGEISAIEWIY